MIRNSAWLALGTLVLRVFPLFLLWLVLREGEPSAYGVYALAASIVAIGSLAAEGGIGLFATSQTDLNEPDQQRLAGRGLLLGCLYLSLALLMAWGFSWRPGLHSLALYVLLMGVCIPFAGPAAVCVARLQRRSRFRQLGRLQSIAAVLSLTAGFLAFFAGWGIWCLVLQAGLGPLLYYGQLLLSPDSLQGVRLRGALNIEHRTSLRYSLAANVLGTLGRRADDLLIGVLVGPAALGQYALGYRVLTTGTELLLHSLERVSVAGVSGAKSEILTAVQLWRQNQRRMAAVASPAFLLAGCIAYVAVPRLIGPDWQLAAVCALLLCMAGAVQSTYYLTYTSLFSLFGARTAFIYQLGLVVALLAGTLSGLVFGVIGASAGYFVGSVVGGAWAKRSATRATRAFPPKKTG